MPIHMQCGSYKKFIFISHMPWMLIMIRIRIRKNDADPTGSGSTTLTENPRSFEKVIQNESFLF
jgi:hypothetical protein